MQLMAEELDKDKTENSALTFAKAAEKYILAKENVLSPSTIRSYHAIIKYLSDRFKSLRISELEAENVQVEINHYCVGRSPKTTRNAHGFISAVLALYKPN